MEMCERCKEYKFTGFGGVVRECLCKEFDIINEEGEEHSVWAADDQSAALKYAEESNVEGDYYLMNATVTITVSGNRFDISAEPDVHYSASKSKPDAPMYQPGQRPHQFS